MTDNELIAAFMGLDFNQYQSVSYFEPPKYHSSWDQIIPVAEKIKHLTFKDLKSQELPTFQQASARWRAVQNEISNLKIESAHYCIVKWINWYNSQPK